MIGDCQHLPTFDSARQSELQAMGSKKLSVDLRNKIVSRHRSGEGYGKISAALQAPESTVATIIRKWKKFGTTKNLPRPGRPAKLSIRGRPALAREVSRNPRVSLTELQRILVEMGEPFRRSTIQAALIKALWKSGQTEAPP